MIPPRELALSSTGADSPLTRAHAEVVAALTTSPTGGRLRGHNEVKVKNARVTGVGILSNGRPVRFEGLTADGFRGLFGSAEPPVPIRTEGMPVLPGEVVIPRTVWQGARDRNNSVQAGIIRH